MVKLLTADEIREALLRLNGWKRAGQTIIREFTFQDFDQAVRFVRKVANAADRLSHHPDVDIRWNRVKLMVTSHADGGLTAKDFKLAATIDGISI